MKMELSLLFVTNIIMMFSPRLLMDRQSQRQPILPVCGHKKEPLQLTSRVILTLFINGPKRDQIQPVLGKRFVSETAFNQAAFCNFGEI